LEALMANGKKYHEIGLDNRTRDDDGEIRQKRGDTLVRTLRQEYGPNFAPGVRKCERIAFWPAKSGNFNATIVEWSRISALAPGAIVRY
jgi:hypothetical protein